MKAELNDRLTQTDAGTPMGKLFRRYWLPALVADELPHPDCPPVRLPILGERLLAFRDTKGDIGIVSEDCPHRLASLYFGRCEDGGIRCAYHGWKFDRHGRCLDIPSEPETSQLKDRVTLTSYSAIERGGVIWIYMGEKGTEPPPPEFEWANLSKENLFASRRLQDCNYLQVLEGGLDSSHLSWLHDGTLINDPIMGLSGSGTDSRILEIMKSDRSPKFRTIERDGGLIIGARRNAGEGRYYWRITQFILPCFNIIAPTGDLTLNGQAWVPMDDHRCWSWAVNYYMDKPLSEQEREYMRKGAGLHVEFVPGTFQGKANAGNDYLRDLGAQRRGDSFTGIPSFAMQDSAVQESQGIIADRSEERLVSSDIAISKARAAMLKAIERNEAGDDAPGRNPTTHGLRAASIIGPFEELQDVPMEVLQPWGTAGDGENLLEVS